MKPRFIVLLLLTAALVVGPWLAYWRYLANLETCPDSLSVKGQLGDSFGILSSLFSALGFVGAIYAILQQSSDSQDAKEHAEYLMRQAKLEKLIESLLSLKHAATSGMAVFDSGGMPSNADLNLYRDKLLQLYTTAESYCKLYFPLYVDEVTPEELWQRALVPAMDVTFQIADTGKFQPGSVNRVMNELMADCQNRIDFCLKNADPMVESITTHRKKIKKMPCI